MRRLVLWDIDHTLVDYKAGLGCGWYAQVLAQVTGRRMAHQPDMAGRTERAITEELLTSHGIEVCDELVAEMFAALVRIVEADRALLAERGRALPGARAALRTLAECGDVVQSLVTGNLPKIAHHKLSPFGLHEHLDFEIGGYGSESAHRPDLVRTAIKRATGSYGGSPAESVIVIGDTPHDVTAALEHGIVAVGVATGRYTVDELQAAGAHTVLTDLSSTHDVLAAVLQVF